MAFNEWALSDRLAAIMAASRDQHASYAATHPGFAALVPFRPEDFAVHTHAVMNAVFPQLLILLGGALLAVVLRARLRGGLFGLAALAVFIGSATFSVETAGLPTFFTPFGEAVRDVTSGNLWTAWFEPVPSGRPAWVLIVAVMLAFAAVLLPALLRGQGTNQRPLPRRRDVVLAGSLGGLTTLAALAFHFLVIPLNETPSVSSTFVLGAGAAIASLTIGRGIDRNIDGNIDGRHASALVASYALFAVPASHASSVAGVAFAAAVGAATVGIGALPAIRWRAIRARLNARGGLAGQFN